MAMNVQLQSMNGTQVSLICRCSRDERRARVMPPLVELLKLQWIKVVWN